MRQGRRIVKTPWAASQGEGERRALKKSKGGRTSRKEKLARGNKSGWQPQGWEVHQSWEKIDGSRKRKRKKALCPRTCGGHPRKNVRGVHKREERDLSTRSSFEGEVKEPAKGIAGIGNGEDLKEVGTGKLSQGSETC